MAQLLALMHFKYTAAAAMHSDGTALRISASSFSTWLILRSSCHLSESFYAPAVPHGLLPTLQSALQSLGYRRVALARCVSSKRGRSSQRVRNGKREHASPMLPFDWTGAARGGRGRGQTTVGQTRTSSYYCGTKVSFYSKYSHLFSPWHSYILDFIVTYIWGRTGNRGSAMEDEHTQSNTYWLIWMTEA